MTAAARSEIPNDFSTTTAAALPDFARMADPETITLHLADTLACALGAEALPDATEGTLVRVRRVRHENNRGSASVWVDGAAATTDDAAFRNAVAARYLDYNDTYIGRAIVHPSDLIPALVALAEEREISWPKLIEAISVSYEVLCRIADKAELRRNGWDGSTLSPIGAAAGAAWLIGLNERGIAAALSIAALDAGTLRAVRQGRLSDWKAIASGRGAIKGLFAARMAEAGCRAPDHAFEGAEGFMTRISGQLELDTGGAPRLQRTILKAHAAQIFIQGMIELAQLLREQLRGASDEVAEVKVSTFRQAVDMVGGAGHPPGAAMNRETADHSAPFAIAAVLVSGKLGHEDYPALLKDPSVVSLMSKVILEEAAEASQAFPQNLATTMTATLTDGRRLSVEQRGPTALGPAGLAAKFAALWPPGIERDWRWRLPGEAPRFPVGAISA